MNKYSIAFDVGGLFIKSAVLNEGGEIVPNSYAIFPSKSKETKEGIIEHLVFIIKQQTNGILDKEFEINGVGYAFPGPFDYDRGISYIKGIDKFEAIYGVNLYELLLDRLQRESSFHAKTSNAFQIVFDNDASLFALGEYVSGKAGCYNKSIFLTMGTGAGSAFMENGKLVKDRQDVPEHGWIYNQPFKESIIDDYISKRGILRLANELGLSTVDNEVETLAVMARNEDPRAKMLFQRLGNDIGKALNPFIEKFKPDAIILGGQITKSKDLFMNGIYETLEEKSISIECSEETSLSTFKGVANLLKQCTREKE
ncbi:glucokinase [Paenibacillus castaneae]|uniref:ROK family protein n=1 Tax=Paenibacillus castaneae TaxID=474957 RepID=UPI000C9C318F|nr:ROK family protein [Paenibacillus castaneae]NIK78725.1 glucokinase [Paenibacillus castaneae]